MGENIKKNGQNVAKINFQNIFNTQNLPYITVLYCDTDLKKKNSAVLLDTISHQLEIVRIIENRNSSK